MSRQLKNNLMRVVLCAALTLAAAMLSYPQLQTVFTAAAARKLPIYCVDTAEKKIAITFDAAWGANDTDELLQILADNNVRASFFFCGYWVEKYPEDVKRFYEAGHDIGNHGDTHAHVTKLNHEQNRREILDAHEKVKKLLGIEMNLYRPPYGEYNNTVIEAAESAGYYVIQWDVDSLDTKIEVDRSPLNQYFQTTSILPLYNNTLAII